MLNTIEERSEEARFIPQQMCQICLFSSLLLFFLHSFVSALIIGAILHVPFLRIHHIYVMYFTSFRRVIFYSNVGWCVKGSAVHHSRQQSLVAEWLGLSVTVRVKVRARARECDFSVLFFFFCVKSDKHLQVR